MDANEQRAREFLERDARFLIAYTCPHPIREFVISNLVARGWLTDEHTKKCELTPEGEAVVNRAIIAALAQQAPEGEPLEFLDGIDPNSGFYLDNYWLGLVRNDDGSVTLRNARGTPLAAIAAAPTQEPSHE